MTYVEMTPENVEPCVKKHYAHLLHDMKIVQRYECPVCHELESNEYSITPHLLGHAIDERISRLWKQGKTLKEIDDLYHIFCSVTPDNPTSYDNFLECHHNVTKDNCFKISYLQCCDLPAYQIVEITHTGKLKVWGIGGWNGGYGQYESLGALRDPRPKSELYIYPYWRGK